MTTEAIGHLSPRRLRLLTVAVLCSSVIAQSTDSKWESLYQERLTWWSLQPIAAPAAPEVNTSAWPRNDIDRFILAALEAKNLAPAPEADRTTLARRLSFALTGLPPKPSDV